MVWLNVVLLLYSILVILMGLLGYLNGHSLISLISGTVSGMIVLGSLAWAKTSPRNARITSLAVATLLMLRFAKKTFFENKLYPDGILFTASLAVVLCLLIGHMIGMRQKRAREAKEANHS